jgi:iron complex outermembrane recepter protein
MSDSNSIRRRAMSAASAYVIGALALALGVAGAASAQEGSPSQESQASTLDEIVVTGIRGALSDAIRTKRNRDTIGEGISADDIGSLPALDIAEALQVVPGVQVNRENNDGAFRYGEISLRGLPGAFTNTTANGQSFASPSGSVTPAEGVPNAFGAFSSSVFDGVWVNKSARADLVEGGIAGTVDQRLARALSRRDGEFTVRVGAQYEELPGEAVGNLFATGTKHLIEDRLAVTFKLAHEQEHFRRDGVNFTTYTALRTDGTRNRGGFYDPLGGTFDQWRTANGIAADETVLYPSNFRQYAETREGSRTSFVGGLEYQATPELKFAANYLYSNRELDLSAEWLLPSPAGITTSITPTTTPFAGFTDSAGRTVWVVPGYDYLDITYAQSSRGGFNTQESEGVFLSAEYESDRWKIDGSIAASEAEFVRVSTNYQAQYLARTSNGHLTNNGTFGSINSGAGDIDRYLFTLNLNPAVTSFGANMDLVFPRTDNPTLNQITVTDGLGNQSRFTSAGNEVFRDRSDYAVNLNFERELDLGLLRSVKFGARQNWQNVESWILNHSIAGMDTTGITNALFRPGTTDFFGRRTPAGAFLGGEWQFLDIGATEAALRSGGISNPNNHPVSPFNGAIYQQTATGSLVNANRVASTDTTITALYAMANFEGNLFGFDFSGNSGVRYVRTELDGEGFSIVNNVSVPTSASKSYENILPALNVSVELTPDLYLRFAYSEGMNRPNPAGFTPSTSVVETPGAGGGLGRVNVALPGLNVEAYTSQNFDVSLEWYNRRGSLLSVAAFRKNVEGFISQRQVCPLDGGGLGFGTLTLVDLGGGISECTIDGDGREILISESFNFDSTIDIEGVEIAVQQDLSFLDNPFLAGFGVQASASFLSVGGEDSAGNPARVQQISDQSYNVATYWENDQFSARLAYNWRSDYFLQGGLTITGAEARQVAPRGQLDFIARFNVTDDIIITGRAFNILDVVYEEYQSGNEQMVRQTAYDGRTFSVDLTYKF